MDTILQTFHINNKTIKTLYLTLITLIFCLLLPTSSHAKNNVHTTLVTESKSVTAGKNIKLGVVLDAPKGWHTYWKDPGDAGLPTKLKWKLPKGFSASEIDWPKPTKFAEGDLTTYGYTGKTTLPVTISTPSKLNDNSYIFTVKAEWLVCNNICIPESKTLSIELPVSTIIQSSYPQSLPQNKLIQTTNSPKSEKPIAPISFLITLSFALIGGLILNIMPCVLPVLSIKALSLVKKSGQTRSHTIRHGISYTLGILISFAAIASLLIALQKGGAAIGWGFQMQSPIFIGFLIYLLFLVGLSLSGVFHLPVLLGGAGGNITNENSIRGSFFTGILAALVATPCTAPFMASAVGAALTMPAWAAMSVFLSLGFGLALPFLLISIFPNLLRFLPKPGAWMERFKELLAFPIYASVIWLIWVLGKQVGVNAIMLILFGLLLILFTIWLQRANKNCNISYRLFTLFASAIMLTAILTSLTNSNVSKASSIPYSAQTLTKLRSEGKAIYVDVTAAWCITCQLNKNVALNTKRTKQAFKQYNITYMIADWTSRDPKITKLLNEFGYDGIPLNIFYPKNEGKPIIMPQILSEEIVIKTISQ